MERCGTYPQPCTVQDPRGKVGSRYRVFAELLVELVPFRRTRLRGGTQAHHPAQHRKRHADPQESDHAAPSGSAPARSRVGLPSPAHPSSTSPAPKPQGSRSPGGAGGRSEVSRPWPKRRSPQARELDQGALCRLRLGENLREPRPHHEPLVFARPNQAPRYGVPLGPSLGSLLQSGCRRPPHRLLEQFKPQVSPESPANSLGVRLALSPTMLV